MCYCDSLPNVKIKLAKDSKVEFFRVPYSLYWGCLKKSKLAVILATSNQLKICTQGFCDISQG